MTRYGADQCPYCYPGTKVLKNKFNIRDEKKLSDLEKMSTLIRDAELVETPIKGLFDLNHLQKIHRYLFRDIYDFAGKTRTIQISKGGFPFCHPMYITSMSDELFAKLKKEDYLKGSSSNDFAKRSAFYMSELNVIHPFREGNGRTQRAFIRCVAQNAGFELEWDASKNPIRSFVYTQSRIGFLFQSGCGFSWCYT